MSPEQARGELDRLGPRSDVYSLGATLYCLLTGKPPFEGDDIGAILRSVQTGEFPAPRSLTRRSTGPWRRSAKRRWHFNLKIVTPRPRLWPMTSSGGWPTSR